MVTRHVRFALHGVTLDGAAMPGATMDCWEDERGLARWSVRLVTRSGPTVDEGELAGTTTDGRVVSGHVLVADREVGAGGRREMLVVFHGAGALHGLDDKLT